MNATLDKVIKKHIVLTALTGLAVVLLMITITYGLYQTNHENTTDQEISLGDFDVDITSTSGQITLANLNPGVENSATYTFTTSNSGDYVVKYNVYFTDNTTTFLADETNASTYSNYTQITSENYQYIEYKLDNGEYKPLSDVYDSSSSKFTIITGRLRPNISYNHTVKFKVSSNAPNDIQGAILALNITMDATVAGEVGTDTIMNLVAGESTSSTDVITKTAPQGATCTNTLAYDGTVDNNLRFVGANPCNYVTFNGETAGWRIIGVMNNIDDGTGNLETRIKLIRATELGMYSWDTSASDVNSGYGINDWTQADLMNELNGDYLDTTLTENTNWYNGRYEAQTGEFNITKRIGTTAQNLIGNAKWYLGGMEYTSTDLIPNIMYTLERGTKVWGSTNEQTCNDGFCPRSLNWTGKIALIYPSDYGFATAGGTTTSRNACIRTLSCDQNSSESWVKSNYSDCKGNDWLKPPAGYQEWFLSPSSTNARSVFGLLSNNSNVSSYIGYNKKSVYPTFYLQSGVTISGGNGTQSEPYVIE